MPQNRYSRPPFPRYEVEDFEKHAAIIKRLYDKAFDYFETLAQDKSELEERLRNKENELMLLKQKLVHTSEVSIIQSIVLIVATVLFGFGVNLATSSGTNSAGWIMSIAGISLQVLAIMIPLLSKLRRGN